VRSLSLGDLRAFAVRRSLFAPTTLAMAIERLGFVQADPIRAPARAQDLTLRHRVEGYRAGDLDRAYMDLDIEEDFFVNYGFLPRRHAALMHPRGAVRAWSGTTRRRAARILEFVQARGSVHPREVEERYSHGKVTNYWGGTSNATTHLLDAMHHRGLLRVARRESGMRVYAPRDAQPPMPPVSKQARADALLALAFSKYAPMPERSLRQLASRLRRTVPQVATHITRALVRTLATSPRATIGGVTWLWPREEVPTRLAPAERRARFLAPFDPVVWDRLRFELFWGWAYRFEAYTPRSKRKLGYYALPLLWGDAVIGWGNFEMLGDRLTSDVGYVSRRPRDKEFGPALDEEVERMRGFLEARG
jgi:uncharacterized protein YcaQ